MTDLTPHDDLPGSRLLKIARVIFDESVLQTVVQPTIADLQRELRASADRRTRLVARLRGYRAFWTLMLVAPFAFFAASDHPRAAVAFPVSFPASFPDRAGRVAVSLISATLLAFTWRGLGPWTLVAAIGGCCAAIAIHAWNNRHPSVIVLAETQRRPEINLSSIPVHANAGGLIFVVGSVAIVLLGLPALRWFLLVAVVLGAVVARALLAWHASHPLRGLPENRIVLR